MSLTKKILALITAGVLSISIAACSKTEEEDTSKGDEPLEQTTITYALWDENQYPVYQEIVKEFEKLNPDIKVEVQLTPWAQYWTKLDAALGGGDAADVFWMNTYIPKYANAGMIAPLDGYIAESNVDMNNYVPAITELWNFEGKQYGMPKGMDTVQVFYNKQIFDKYDVAYPAADWTWEQMEAIGEELRDAIAAADGNEYALTMELDHQPSFFNFLWQEGTYVVSEDGKESGFNTPEAAKSYQDVIDLMDSGVMPEFKVLSDTKGTDIFLAGNSGMVVMGSWKAALMDSASFAKDIGIVPMAKKADNNDSVLAGLCFAMNENSENKEASWKLIEFLAGETSNKMQAEAKIDMPALISAQQYYTPNFENIDASIFFEIAETAYPFPTSPSIPEWYGVVGEISTEIYSGNISAEEGCAKIHEEMMTFLSE